MSNFFDDEFDDNIKLGHDHHHHHEEHHPHSGFGFVLQYEYNNDKRATDYAINQLEKTTHHIKMEHKEIKGNIFNLETDTGNIKEYLNEDPLISLSETVAGDLTTLTITPNKKLSGAVNPSKSVSFPTYGNTINNLSADNTKNKTDINDLKIKTTNTQNQLNTVQTTLDNAVINISTLTSGVAQNKANIATHTQQITTLQATDVSLQNQISNATTDISALKVDVTELKNDINKNVVTDENFGYSTSQNAYIDTITKTNIATGNQTTTEKILPLASATASGIMPLTAFKQIIDNTQRIQNIENMGVYIGQSFATYAALIAAPVSPSWTNNDFTYVETDETHGNARTMYVWESSAWTYGHLVDLEILPFTVTSLGTIKGSYTIGDISANADGTGTVNGFDILSLDTNSIIDFLDNRDYVEFYASVDTNATNLSLICKNLDGNPQASSSITLSVFNPAIGNAGLFGNSLYFGLRGYTDIKTQEIDTKYDTITQEINGNIDNIKNLLNYPIIDTPEVTDTGTSYRVDIPVLTLTGKEPPDLKTFYIPKSSGESIMFYRGTLANTGNVQVDGNLFNFTLSASKWVMECTVGDGYSFSKFYQANYQLPLIAVVPVSQDESIYIDYEFGSTTHTEIQSYRVTGSNRSFSLDINAYSTNLDYIIKVQK